MNIETKKAKQTLKSINEALEEERQIDPKMAQRIEKYIEYENKKWILKHRDDVVEIRDTGIVTAKEKLVAHKLTELVSYVDIDNEDVFNTLYKNILGFYESISESNLESFNNSILYKKEGTINCCNNLENYIVEMDPLYAEHLDEKVDWFYENYLEHVKRKEARLAEEVLEDEFEEEKFEEVEEPRRITNLTDWVSELSNYYVDKKKNLVRK